MAFLGTLEEMTSVTRSLRTRRFLGGSVAALLTANAFAVASLVGDDGLGGRLGRPQPLESVIPTPELPSMVLITTGDGDTFAADPETAAGREVIEQAHRAGAEVRTVTVPSGSDDLLVFEDAPIAPDPLGGTGDGGLLDVDPDQVDGLLDDPVETVTTVVEDTRTTVTSIVEDTESTVTTIVEETSETLTTDVEDVTGTVTETVDDTGLLSTEPVCSLLCG